MSAHFDDQLNYISLPLHNKTYQTFSQILLRLRMQRAELLMKDTDLTLEKNTDMIGDHTISSFYRTFQTYFWKIPKNLADDKR